MMRMQAEVQVRFLAVMTMDSLRFVHSSHPCVCLFLQMVLGLYSRRFESFHRCCGEQYERPLSNAKQEYDQCRDRNSGEEG